MDVLSNFALGMFPAYSHMQPYINIEWHYNEAHHGKGPMDGIGGTVKNLVYRRVLSGDVVINTPKEFANFADQITSVDCIFLENTELLKEPEEVTKAPPIPSTLKIHKTQRVANGSNSFSNLFFKSSEDIEPFYTETYGIQCGHRVNNIDDESLCNNCYKMYVRREEWLKCPVCCQWYHEDCFYV